MKKSIDSTTQSCRYGSIRFRLAFLAHRAKVALILRKRLFMAEAEEMFQKGNKLYEQGYMLQANYYYGKPW